MEKKIGYTDVMLASKVFKLGHGDFISAKNGEKLIGRHVRPGETRAITNFSFLGVETGGRSAFWTCYFCEMRTNEVFD